MATTSDVRRKLDERIVKVSGYQNVIAGRLGYTSSQIETTIPGLVYVRVEGSGQVVTAINMIVPLIWDLPVLMARSKINPKLFEIVAPREAYGIPSAGGGALRNHHKQHEYPSADTVWVKGDQFLPFLVLPKEEFVVSIYGGAMTLGDVRRRVKNQELDLSSEVPVSGAVWVLIQVESTGSIGTVISDEVDSKELLNITNIPFPDTGAAELCAIKLYSGQQSLQRNTAVNDFVDLRFGSALSGSGSVHDHFNDAEGDPADVSTSASADGTSSYAARRDHVHLYTPDPGSGGGSESVGHLHGLVRWNGASGNTTFDLPDYAEMLESVMINGLEEDPLVYSLSSDRSQIVLDTALPADSTITAHYVLQSI